MPQHINISPRNSGPAAAARVVQRQRRKELRELRQALRDGALTAQQQKRLWLLLINEVLNEE